MNFKSLLVIGLGFTTLGLALPAHADTAVVNNNQSVIVTGNGNTSNQTNITSVRNTQTSRRTSGSNGSVVNSSQSIDIIGDNNTTNQSNQTTIRNYQRRNH
jgi:hypothetical protein